MEIQKAVAVGLIQFVIIGAMAQGRFLGNSPGYSFPIPCSFTDVPTPEATSLGKYGNIVTSCFTGVPNIRIPFYNLTVRGVTIPITLDYDASGVKVNNIPTWCGQNWNLNIGGVITRTVKGFYDEWIYPRQSMIFNFTNYFQCHDKLMELVNAGDDYSSLKSVLITNNYDFSPDEYSFCFMGKSGKFFLDDTGSWRVQGNDNLEVIFDYNDSSNYIPPLFPQYPSNNVIERGQRKTIAGFVIRDDKGNCYQFGYDRDAIEYTINFWNMSKNENNESWHAQSWFLTKVTDKYGNVLFTLDYDRSAYVIQIFNGYYCNTIREGGGNNLNSHDVYTLHNSVFPYTVSIASPVYLSQIKAMNGLVVDISSSYVSDDIATEKIYKSIYRGRGLTGNFYNQLAALVQKWGPRGYGGTEYELGAFYYLNGSEDESADERDSIAKYRYNPTEKDRYDVFSYSRIRRIKTLKIYSPKAKTDDCIGYRFCMSNVGTRLRLDSLQVQNSAINYTSETGVKEVYRFSYNNFELLPQDYLTTDVDHWGYYNGISYCDEQKRPKENIKAVRNPNFTYTQLGVLSEIHYPTGGVATFEYEPNTFSRYMLHNRQSMADSMGTGGGLRIKTIKLYDTESKEKLLRERNFRYEIPGTNISSGELFAVPEYKLDKQPLRCESNNSYYNISINNSTSILPLASNSSPSLGYTYVTESIKDMTDSSSNIEEHLYKFSNLSDSTARDQRFYLTFGFDNGITPYDEYSDVGFMRGKLLEEVTFDFQGRKVRSTGYKYRTDNFLSGHYAFTSNLQYECYGGSAQYSHYIGGVYKFYYPKYDISEIQDTVFNDDGSLPLINIFSYDRVDKDYTLWHPYRHGVNMRLTQAETIRRNTFFEKKTYNFGQFENCDFNDSLLYKGMSVLTPTSTVFSRNGQMISNTKTVYKSLILNGFLRLVPSLLIKTNKNEETDTLVRYMNYTTTGMPFSYREQGGPVTYLKWAVNDSYLMMRGYGYIPFDFSETEFYDTNKCRPKILQFIKSSSNMYTGYVYNPLFGITSIILPNGNETSYVYDSFGRLVEVKDCDNRRLKEYQYNIRR